MNNKKFNLIIEKLLERTKEGKIEWESTANINTFLAILTDSSISVTSDISLESNYKGLWKGLDNFSKKETDISIRKNDIHLTLPYEFDLRDENGDVVESFVVTHSNQELFAKAEAIYSLARKQALRDNPIVDSILEQLEAA